MSSFFGLPSQDYGAETLLFAAFVMLLTLPLGALIAASLFDDLIRRRAGRGRTAQAPLSLRRARQLEQAQFGPKRAFEFEQSLL